jgi:hypothetical protein
MKLNKIHGIVQYLSRTAMSSSSFIDSHELVALWKNRGKHIRGAVWFGAITSHATLVATTVRWLLFGWRIY